MIDTKKVLAAFMDFKMAGMPLYGEWPKTEFELFAKARIYANALEDANCSEEAIPHATRKLIAEGGNFPSAADLAEACKSFQRTIGIELGTGRVGLVPVLSFWTPERKRQSCIAYCQLHGLPPPPPRRAGSESLRNVDAMASRVGARMLAPMGDE